MLVDDMCDAIQTACLVVLAQIGCFVPAVQACIPVRDRLLTRLATADDMENNLSKCTTIYYYCYVTVRTC